MNKGGGFNITLPAYANFYILREENNFWIYIKNNNQFIYFKFMCTEIVLKKNINGWVKFNYKLNNTNYYNYLISAIIQSWSFFFFKKFKFKSKGLKIKRKKKKNLKFLFWLSHIHLAHIHNCKLKRIGKQKYIFMSSNWIFLKKICKKMQEIRPNDLFTKKGIRLGRQIILKKRGKKVTYI